MLTIFHEYFVIKDIAVLYYCSNNLYTGLIYFHSKKQILVYKEVLRFIYKKKGYDRMVSLIIVVVVCLSVIHVDL
jgi:hypothetical protein